MDVSRKQQRGMLSKMTFNAGIMEFTCFVDSDRIRLYNYRMFVCYCSFHGAY